MNDRSACFITRPHDYRKGLSMGQTTLKWNMLLSLFQFCTSFFLFFKSAKTALIATKCPHMTVVQSPPRSNSCNTFVETLLWKVTKMENPICFSMRHDSEGLLDGSSQVWNILLNKQRMYYLGRIIFATLQNTSLFYIKKKHKPPT